MNLIHRHYQHHREMQRISSQESPKILAEVMREVVRRAAAEGRPIDFGTRTDPHPQPEPAPQFRRQLDLQEIFSARSS